MDLRQRTRNFSVSVILCACILRLGLMALPALFFPIYSETGRNVRFSASSEVFLQHFRESPPPVIPKKEGPAFSAEDLSLVEMDYDCDLRPDLEAYDCNRRTLYEGLRALGYEMAKPDGAFYLFVKAPGGDAVAFSEKAKQKDLLLVPGDGFGCPGYFRICYCVSPEMIQKSLPAFRELIEK